MTAIVHQRAASPTWPSNRTLRLAAIALLMSGVPFGMNIAGRNLPVYDLALMLVCVTAIAFETVRIVTARGVRSTSIFPGAVACVVALAVASAVNPSTRSIENFFTVVGAGVLASQVSRTVAEGKSQLLIRLSFVFVVAQFVISVAQIINDGPIAGLWLGETESGFRPIAGVIAPAGSLIHANALGSVMAIMTIFFLALQTTPSLPLLEARLCLVGSTLSAALAVLSLTRSSILAAGIAIVVALGSTHRKRLAPTIVSIFVFGLAAAILRIDAWIERGKSSVGGVEAAGSGRIALAKQAIAMFKLDPSSELVRETTFPSSARMQPSQSSQPNPFQCTTSGSSYWPQPGSWEFALSHGCASTSFDEPASEASGPSAWLPLSSRHCY